MCGQLFSLRLNNAERRLSFTTGVFFSWPRDFAVKAVCQGANAPLTIEIGQSNKLVPFRAADFHHLFTLQYQLPQVFSLLGPGISP